MTKAEYQERRERLLAEAEQLAGCEGFEAKCDEIDILEEEYQRQIEALANLNSFKNTKNNIFNYGGNQMNDIYNTIEYRKAFKDYVLNGTPIPADFRNDTNATTKTTDVGPVIPTVTLDRIIEKMETLGVLLNMVTRTSYKGGLAIPTSDVKPVATWVSEGAGSAIQKNGVNGTVTFAYHKLRCAVSMTLEVETMALTAFEAKFVKDVSNAMVRALEQAIVSGDGEGKPKGILKETPVDGQAIEIAEGTALSFGTLLALEAALPAEYESGAKYYMTKKTFLEFYGITDEVGQPIARVNYGINGSIERSLLGRGVVIIDNYMDSFAKSVTEDTIVAFIFSAEDYVLNSNLNVTVKTYEDNETEDKVTKAVMLVDGKVVDKNSLVTLTVTKS